jgi:amino acid transporter
MRTPLEIVELYGTPLWIWLVAATFVVLVMVAVLAYFVLSRRPPE